MRTYKHRNRVPALLTEPFIYENNGSRWYRKFCRKESKISGSYFYIFQATFEKTMNVKRPEFKRCSRYGTRPFLSLSPSLGLGLGLSQAHAFGVKPGQA